MRSCLTAIFTTVGASLACAELEHPPRSIHSFSTVETNKEATSWTTRQGPDGVLYFGSDALLKFDGDHWTQFSVDGAPALRGLDFGDDGKLWAAALGEIGFFATDPLGEWSYHSLRAHLPAEHANLGEVWHAFATKEGATFVSADKVIQWNGEKMRIWPFAGARRLPAMRSGGEIYVHHTATGLYKIEADGPSLIIPAASLGKAAVLWMEPRPRGQLLATSEGLFVYENSKLTPYAPEASEFIRRNLLTSAARLADGRLVLGTYQAGLVFLKFDGTVESVLSKTEGLPDNSIYSLFVDQGSELWVTTESATARISVGSPSDLYDRRAGLPEQAVKKIIRSEGVIHVVSDNQVFALDAAEGHFKSLNSIPQQAWEVEVSPGGLLVAGMGGIQKLSAGKIASLHVTQQDVSVIAPARAGSSSLLVSEGRNVVLLSETGASRVLVENLPDFATSIAEDGKGRLWLGTLSQGILMAQENSSAPVEATHAVSSLGLPEYSGLARVAEAGNDRVIAFTAAGAWMLAQDGREFRPVENYPARSTSAVATAAISGGEELWIVHPASLTQAATAARISIRGDHAIWQPHSVDGLWKIGIPKSIFAEVDGVGETVLWIGGTRGVLRHQVAFGPLAPIPRVPLLHAMARNAESQGFEVINHPLPYSTPGIAFEFALPDFRLRPALRFETMLDGIDPSWLPADSTSRREFTALREGSYTFRVRAVAETGATGQPAVTHFEIMPPWWRTGTALLGVLFALIPTGYSLYRWRVRTLRLRNEELEGRVRDRTEELVKASAAKTQFVSNMSHEIRNPLNGIVGLALALEDSALDGKQREIISTLKECTTYLSTLVDDVLDFASIEAGKIELRPAPFTPAELLRSIAAMFKIEAIASGASINVQTDPRLPPAFVGDAARIQQVLVNFVTNALKYSGGLIRLTASIPQDAPEEIEFAVTDEGPGISLEEQKLLFKKFSRLTGSQSKEITGTGLGLAACRLLAGLMSGSVGVRSSSGHGAQFYLRLPLEIFPILANDRIAMPMAAPAFPNCTVLLVEDTDYNAWAAAAVLGRFGLTCERASSGAEALKLFAQKRHNIVLLDRNLPDMDGTEVARRIRLLEADGPRAIMLAVTAYCTIEDRALCLNAGMDAFVGKPLTPEKLRRVLTAAGRRHLAAASMHVSPDIPTVSEVDVSLLEYISDGTGNGLSRQIDLFLSALGEAEKQLEESCRASDFKLLANAAHGVLSHARLVGSASLSTAASALQAAARAEDRRAFGSTLAKVRREIEVLTAVVRRHPGAERSV